MEDYKQLIWYSVAAPGSVLSGSCSAGNKLGSATCMESILVSPCTNLFCPMTLFENIEKGPERLSCLNTCFVCRKPHSMPALPCLWSTAGREPMAQIWEKPLQPQCCKCSTQMKNRKYLVGCCKSSNDSQIIIEVDI